MYNTAFIIIILIIVISYMLSSILEIVNSRNRKKPIPKELKGIYDDENYKKSQDYGTTNSRFSICTSTFSFIVTLIMLFLFGFNFVNTLALSITGNIIASALIFFGIILFASDILNMPFSIYDIFVIEERFGFNTTTLKTFLFDKLKTWFLGALIGGGILALIIWLYSITNDLFWIYAWIAMSLFSIFMSMFYSHIIVPLFNKQTPLPEGELRNAIELFADRSGFKLKNIFMIDGSKRSTKANAYFSGLGKKKRIVLYDTLIKDLSTEEITAVLAHEIGHYKKKHSFWNMLISIIQSGIMLYIFSIFVNHPELSKAMGSETISFQLGLIAFGIMYSPISLCIDLFMNILSRKHEYEADQFAKQNGVSEGLISGLKKLSEKNLSNLTPHPYYVFFYYSHPTLYQRIKSLQ
jgi:STE24 endopeptidase